MIATLQMVVGVGTGSTVNFFIDELPECNFLMPYSMYYILKKSADSDFSAVWMDCVSFVKGCVIHSIIVPLLRNW